MTKNWEVLSYIERRRVNFLEILVKATNSRKFALKVELEVYQIYQKALQRHSQELSKRG